jgi:hypothetical protein
MEPAPRAGDPDQEKDKAVADKETRAEEPVVARAGVKVKVHKEGRVKVGVKAKDHKEGRAKAKAVGDDKAVSKSFGTIY